MKKYDENGMLIGEAPCTKDLITITDKDFKVVSAISIGAIILIIALVLKSITLPVILVAVQDPATIARLSQLNAAVMGTKTDPFYGAPTVVVVLADQSRATWLEDGSLAMGNLMLAAHALGLGSCWVHRAREVFAGAEGQELLRQWGIQGNYAGVAHCLLGYPDGPLPEPKPRREHRIYRR